MLNTVSKDTPKSCARAWKCGQALRGRLTFSRIARYTARSMLGYLQRALGHVQGRNGGQRVACKGFQKFASAAVPAAHWPPLLPWRLMCFLILLPWRLLSYR